jgi:hypothetical protein
MDMHNIPKPVSYNPVPFFFGIIKNDVIHLQFHVQIIFASGHAPFVESINKIMKNRMTK